MSYIMALDQGTTSCRCIIFDKKCQIKAIAQEEFTQIYPKQGWVEHNAEEIWECQVRVARKAMADYGISVTDIQSIGITNQRETTVVWNKTTGKPVYNAIVWQCHRTAKQIDDLINKGYGKLIREKTGLIPDAYFSASKIAWILDNVPEARQKAEQGELLFGTIDCWLIWKLTGGKIHATDYTNASRTLLFDINELEWSSEIAGVFGIPVTMLPKVEFSDAYFGNTEESIFGISIPINGVAGDQQAALFGQTCFEPGDVKVTYGTGCFMLMNTGKEKVFSQNKLLTTIAVGYKGNVEYALEGSVYIGGAVVQWLRDSAELLKNSVESENLATDIPDNGGVYFVPAFTGLGAPYWNQYARGTIFGLDRNTGKRHIIRAALESISYQVNDLCIAMQSDSLKPISSIKVDGGASKNNFLMQFQSDISDTEVVRGKCIETTALGAAFLAGISCGFWKDKDEIKQLVEVDRVFSPDMNSDARVKLLNEWKKAVNSTINYSNMEAPYA